MDVGSSGGGYFYGPFVSTQGFGNFTASPSAIPAAYGNWAHLAVAIPTGKGRWFEMIVWPQDYGSIYTVQIGRGAIGAETLFQPSDGTGFYIDWFSAIKWPIPYRLSFPTSVGLNQELCVRCASVPGGGQDLNFILYLWN